MKLTKNKLVETLRRKNEGWTTYQARKIAGISIRRVNQVWKEYQETEEIPELRKPGRPTKPIQDWQTIIVKEAYTKYRVCASTLERVIERDYDKHIPHNRIHQILLKEGLATKGDEKVTRKTDWIRYERRHSLTAVHIDWHQRPNDGIWVFKVEDDASRALLAAIECESPTQEASINTFKEAQQYGTIKQCISDHGSQFTDNQRGESNFKAFLDANNIQQILCRIKHPQSNGKIEKFFDLYEHHRDAFLTLKDYTHWYNHTRPHLSLDFSRLETPWQAFERKRRK